MTENLALTLVNEKKIMHVCYLSSYIKIFLWKWKLFIIELISQKHNLKKLKKRICTANFYRWRKILKLLCYLLSILRVCIEWQPEIIKGSILSFYPTAGMMYLYVELLSIKISMSDSKFLSVSDWDQEYYNLRLIQFPNNRPHSHLVFINK